jgi:arylsulfatase A-like enzyme
MRRLAFAFALVSLNAATATSKPNFLIIIADDLGFSDLGCYGGDIDTPHLDSLAANGLRFTQFYNTTRCWPTRSALLSGYYPQQIRRDALPGLAGKTFGGQGLRPHWAQLLPSRLQPLGYRSYHSGKWHIDGDPTANGFNHSYHAKDQGRFFNPKIHFQDDQPLPPIEKNSGFYSTTHVATQAIAHLQDHATHHPAAPFLTYLAFAAPHFPLQALPQDIAKYRDRYLTGWDQLRQQRHQRQKRLGLRVAELSPLEPDVGPPYAFPDDLALLGPGEINHPLPWDQLSPEQQRFQAAKMAIHAAMIDRMDREIGRVLDQLKAMGAFDNTLILFLSDNGASAEIMVRDDGHDPAAPMGSAASYLCLGPGFSSAANTPFRRHKTWVHEGGISTPFIAHWPAGIPEKNAFRTTPAHVIDIMPTVLELAGAPAAALAGAPSLPGCSLVPAFKSHSATIHDALWFFHEGNRAFRQGDWKIVADNQSKNWSLYDLKADRAEQHDLATQQPGRVQSMAAHWQSLADTFRKTALQGLTAAEIEAAQTATNAKGPSKAKGKGKTKAKTKAAP